MFYFYNVKWLVIKNGEIKWSYAFKHLAEVHASLIGGEVKEL